MTDIKQVLEGRPTPWVYQEESDTYTHIIRDARGKFVLQLSQRIEQESLARGIVAAINSLRELAEALESVLAYVHHESAEAALAKVREAGL